MKTYQPGVKISVKADADVVRNRFVRLDGNYAGADEKALGVLELDAAQGAQATVVCTGVALVESGGEIVVGDNPVAVTSAANGQAAAVTTTEPINGYALDGAAGQGELIRVLLA